MKNCISLLVVMLISVGAMAGDNVVVVATSGGDFSDPADAADWVAAQAPDSDNRYVILVEPGRYELGRAIVLPSYTTLKGHARLQTHLIRNTAEVAYPYGAVVRIEKAEYVGIESLTILNQTESSVSSGIRAAVVSDKAGCIYIRDAAIIADAGVHDSWVYAVLANTSYLRVTGSTLSASGREVAAAAIGLYQLTGIARVETSMIHTYSTGAGDCAVYQADGSGGLPAVTVESSTLNAGSEAGGSYYYYREGDGNGRFHLDYINPLSTTNVTTHHYRVLCHDGFTPMP